MTKKLADFLIQIDIYFGQKTAINYAVKDTNGKQVAGDYDSWRHSMPENKAKKIAKNWATVKKAALEAQGHKVKVQMICH